MMSRFSIPSFFLILCCAFVYGNNTEPVITLNGPNPQYVDSGGVYEELGAVAYDDEDGSLTDQIVISGSVNTNYPGNYTIQYVVTDSDGNSTVMNRTVTVTDQTPPVIILQGNSTVSVEVFNSYTELGAIATDEYDGDLSSSIIIAGTVNTSIIGVYSIVYSVTDSHGNTASVTRTVVVIDSTPPVINLNGATTIYLELGSTYTELGATATDNYDGNLSSEIFLSGSVDTSTAGTYYISYNATDSSGNISNQKVRTIIVEDMSPSILVTKTVSSTTDNFIVGDRITYTIGVKNIGGVNLNTLNITDTLKDISGVQLDLVGNPNADWTSYFTGSSFDDDGDSGTVTNFSTDTAYHTSDLQPNEEVTFTAIYIVDQDAIDAGGVENIVTVTTTADDGDNSPVLDTTDYPVVVMFNSTAAIEVTETTIVNDNGDGFNGLGDTIIYTITIENKGNVTLTGIDITDTMIDGAGQSLTRTSPSTFSTYTLAPGERVDIQATYTIEQFAADTGSISNTVSVDGTTPDGTMISDDIDAPVVVLTDLSPSIEVINAAIIYDGYDDGYNGIGDIIEYTIAVENTGNVTLSDVYITDNLTALNGDLLTLTTGPTFISNSYSSTERTLQLGETATYFATYEISQQAVDAGGVSFTAIATASTPNNFEDVVTVSNSTTIVTNSNPSLAVTKEVEHIVDDGDGFNGSGDIIVYTIKVENNGNVTIENISLTDTLTDASGNKTDLSANIILTDVNGISQTSLTALRVWDIATYNLQYTIDQSAADTGSISNTVSVVGTAPDGTEVSDELATPVVVLTNSYLAIDFTKYATITDTNGDGTIGIGDLITYTLVATNTGNDALSSVAITDIFSDLSGNALTLTTQPTFISASFGSAQGSLQIGEQATYRATFTVNNQAINAGGVSNTATVTAQGTSGTVTDTSDDPSTSAPNDATVSILSTTPSSSIVLTKAASISDTNGDGTIGLGDTITYTLVATNTGNDALSSVAITDIFSDLSGNALTLTTQPTFISASFGSAQGSLQIGEQATYRATFTVNNQAINAGGVSNTATVTAQGTSGTVTDNSDDPSTATPDDPTLTALISQPIDNENILLNGNVYITKSNGLIIKSGDDCFRIKVNNGNVVAEPVNCEQ